MVLSHTGLEDRKRPVAPSAEICGSSGNAPARGGSLFLSGVAACAVGFDGCGNRSFTYTLDKPYEALKHMEDTHAVLRIVPCKMQMAVFRRNGRHRRFGSAASSLIAAEAA